MQTGARVASFEREDMSLQDIIDHVDGHGASGHADARPATAPSGTRVTSHAAVAGLRPMWSLVNFWRCAMAFSARCGSGVELSARVRAGHARHRRTTLMLRLPAQLVNQHGLFAGSQGFLAYSIVGTSMVGIFLASYGGIGRLRAQ